MEVAALTHHAVAVSAEDSSLTGQARREAVALANSLGFGEVRLGELSIIVMEAANNITVHAQRGELVLSPWTFNGEAGVDVFALDSGPGIVDMGLAFEDGYSTAGTAGEGLGAISRMADSLQVYSVRGSGTVLFARVSRERADKNRAVDSYPISSISLPKLGESICGDAWSSTHSAGRSAYILADGLGHGPGAAEASREAIQVFHEIADESPERILMGVHAALAKTRGAAVSVAEILHEQATLNYAGAGNISAAVYSEGKTRSMLSMNGTVGHSIPQLQQITYPWVENSTFIMHSDGLSNRTGVEKYPGLASRQPGLIAAVLYRDFGNRRDDATVVVSREHRQ